jgi:methylmalonyl-CoA/ethylmalonyl-CoA epimerase
MLDNFIFHHIGYAVHDIAVTAEYYVKAGFVLSEIQVDTTQNSYIAFLSKDAFPLIELVAPIDGNSPVVKTLDKMGVTPYHICYEVDDIDQSIAALEKKRFLPLFNPVEAIALNDRKICYLFNKDVGLIELLNKSNK